MHSRRWQPKRPCERIGRCDADAEAYEATGAGDTGNVGESFVPPSCFPQRLFENRDDATLPLLWERLQRQRSLIGAERKGRRAARRIEEEDAHISMIYFDCVSGFSQQSAINRHFINRQYALSVASELNHPQDFEDKYSTLAREVQRHGIVVPEQWFFLAL